MSGPVCKILIVDDEVDLAQALAALLGNAGYACAVCTDGARAYDAFLAECPDLVLTDLRMPGSSGMDLLKKVRHHSPTLPVILLTAFATVDLAVEAMREGAADFLAKPFLPEELLAKIRGGIERSRAREGNRGQIFRGSHALWEVVAASRNPRMREVFALAEKTAPTDSKVLITGESGTGKELVARLIHRLSPLRDRGFFAVNCAALTETLLESELFGHERGAFTGAVSTRKGIFEVASDGTLFLDEIGDSSPKLQLDLLRVLDAREFRRVGGSQLIKTDVRILAATNRGLKKLVESGAFREDLYYRLNVIPVTLPPLRERKEDIPLLVEHFLAQSRTEMQKPLEGVSAEAMEMLMAHDWPGNVRELRNVLERGAVMARGPIITPMELELALPALLAGATPTDSPDSLRDVERKHIVAMLKQQNWNITRSARALGIDRVTLYNKIKRYQIREDE